MSAIYTQHHGTYLAHRIMLEGRGEDAFAKNILAARVETKPHQVDAALFALHSPLAKGAILADEVGLGKTIEACLVITQRWAECRRRILLVVPASLRKQWQQELQEKFSLPSRIMEARTWREAQKAGISQPFDAQDSIVLTSYEFAARRADDVARVPWDLVIFDEAHRLRNVYKKTGSARAKALRDAVADRFKLMLTATPLQNSLMELYGLVSVLDSHFFCDERTFKTMYEGRNTDAGTLVSLRRRMEPIYKRHLRRDVQEAGHVSFTKREATTFDFEPSSLEADLYEKVSAYLQRPDSIAFGLHPNQLVIIQARKILGSSVAAIMGFLQTVIDRLRRKQVADLSTVADVGDGAELAEELDEAVTFSASEQSNEPLDAEDAGDILDIDSIKLKAEIEELERYIALARKIGANAKGEKLVSRLPDVLDEIVRKGGRRKVVIFTESVRTQAYLSELLSRNGYADQIVLMNGSNTDSQSLKVYKEWCARHKGTDVVSGSKSADMKAAIVEAFRGDERSILIATESGAEGINLQFCSIVLNFDLPWNPQRVEQRIGRCHRYGQKIDVTVVNMLNRKNVAEQRVYELLDKKFRLFEGVFGASDTVLGAVESGIDFERKVVEAVQRGRTDQEVEAEFRRIEEELEARITDDMQATQRKLFDNLDRDVVARLRKRGDDLQFTLDAFEQRLLTIVRAEAPEARFHDPDMRCFDFDGKTWTTEWPLADKRGWQFFRVAENTLAADLVARACARNLEATELHFDYSAYVAAGWPQLSRVKNLAGLSGWLKVSLLSVLSPDTEIGRRDRLVVVGSIDDYGDDMGVLKMIDAQTVDDLFLVPATSAPLLMEMPREKLANRETEATAEALAAIEREGQLWLDEETEKLDAYSDDLERASELRVMELDTEIKAAKKALRANAGLALAGKVKEQRRIKAMEGEVDDLKMTTFQKRKEVRLDIDARLDEIARALQTKPTVTQIFNIRWTVSV